MADSAAEEQRSARSPNVRDGLRRAVADRYALSGEPLPWRRYQLLSERRSETEHDHSPKLTLCFQSRYN